MLPYVMPSAFFSTLLCSVYLILFVFYSVPFSFSWISFTLTYYIQYIKLVPIPIPSLLLQKFICHFCVSKWISNSFGIPLSIFIPCPYFLTELCSTPFLFCNKVLLYSLFPVIWYFIGTLLYILVLLAKWVSLFRSWVYYISFLSAVPYIL